MRLVCQVVEATYTAFVAQCYRLYDAPPLGSFVRAGDPAVHGVVYRVTTEPLDASRPVLARGESAATQEDVFRNNPQLSRLFTTRFEALIIGHESGEECKQYLPPLPPPVHSFAYACTSGEIAAFTSRLDFLSLVLNCG